MRPRLHFALNRGPSGRIRMPRRMCNVCVRDFWTVAMDSNYIFCTLLLSRELSETVNI